MQRSQFISTVHLGVKSLLLHKLRSGLTMLGIIFGVCSVISMLAIGEGASYEAQEAIKKLGSTNIIIRSLKPPDEASDSGGGGNFELNYGLTYEDGARLQSTIPGVVRVLPMRIIRENVRFNVNLIPCQVIGTLPFYPGIVGVDIVKGRFLCDADEKHQQNVCAITTALASRLFPYQAPLDQAVKIAGVYYRVVGLVQELNTPDKRAQTEDPEGETLDNFVYIPISTSRSRFGETIFRGSFPNIEAESVELHEIRVKMASTEFVETAAPQIKNVLNRFHDQGDYEVIVPLQLLRQAEATKRIFNIVLGSIAAISLLVGGIGIMNIMLATVTERTREIGVRRALGAKKQDITTQFLVETVVLSVGGGLIGVLIGVLVPLMVTYLADMKTIVTWWSVAIAFSISGAIGILFGLYPATAAANLDPIDALRHE
ncbi:MAG TPA: FtsX-like permease family protein [Verrucomicrobiales bacterium]|nr:FtsX-like permease family protein [Verrucomicrobiales bacterium]HIL68255.1 FtsX-like permease family protein [Verrucomicrobiota bacterium]